MLCERVTCDVDVAAVSSVPYVPPYFLSALLRRREEAGHRAAGAVL